MRHYREVQCSDRLPDKDGPYYVKMKEINRGMQSSIIFALHDIYIWEGKGDPNERELWLGTFDSWLEELSATDDVELENKIIEAFTTWISYTNYTIGENEIALMAWKASAKALTALFPPQDAKKRYEKASKHWDSKREGLKIKGPPTIKQANSLFDLFVECLQIASGHTPEQTK